MSSAATYREPLTWQPERPRFRLVRVATAWILAALALMAAAWVVPGASIEGFWGALLVSAIVAGLNAVQPWDWAKFLHGWLDGVGDEVPLLSGIEQGGWKLVYTATPSRYQNAVENVGEGELDASGVDETFSVGLFIRHNGSIMDVLWQGPAFKAGLAPGMKLQAVDGHAYAPRTLRDAIVRAQKDGQPIRIQAEADGVSRTYAVHYDGGLKYPHLVREQGSTDYLKQLLAPKPVGSGP